MRWLWGWVVFDCGPCLHSWGEVSCCVWDVSAGVGGVMDRHEIMKKINDTYEVNELLRYSHPELSRIYLPLLKYLWFSISNTFAIITSSSSHRQHS